MPQPVSGQGPLSDRVADYLRQAILDGEIAEGATIKAEWVARTLNTSATPVREAIQSLRGEGFLESKPNRGFRVTRISARDIRDAFRARALLAGELAGRAADRVTDADLADIGRLHTDVISAIGQGRPEDVERLAKAFHGRIYDIADSPQLRWSLSTLARFSPSHFYDPEPGAVEVVARSQERIVRALARRDRAAAREAMQDHVELSGELVVEHVEGRRSNAGAAPRPEA